MPYKVAAWIPVDVEDPEIYTTKEFADTEKEHLELMQPENIYEVQEV